MLTFALAALLATGPAPAARPIVTGTLRQGERLTATAGTWLGAGAIAYTYQWYRCNPHGGHCRSIHGATAPTYTQVAADVRRTIGLTVRATDATGTTAAYASLSGIVAPVKARIAPLRPPQLFGDPVVGVSLHVGAAAWTEAPGAAAYRWDRCNANGRACAPIPDARADAYTLGAADVGHVLIARVTASRRTVLSLGSQVIRAAPGPSVVGGPVVTGIARAGKRLTGTAGTWSGAGAIRYAYQWYRCDSRGAHCTTIRGATRPTYTEGSADVGHTLGLGVRATDSAGTATANASLVGPVVAVAAPLASTVQPTLSGVAAVGQSLAVAGGAWSTRPGSVTYSWLRCNANGRLCTAIVAATGPTYTVAAADRGSTIVATVTATAGATRQDALTVASPVVR